MLRSRKVEDYLPCELQQLKAGVSLPCDLYLVFPKSQHVMVFRRAGDTPEQEFLDRYLKRGLSQVWIYTEDRALFAAYLAGDLSPADRSLPVPVTADLSPPESTPPPQNPPPPPQTEAGATLCALMESRTLDEPEKSEAVADVARTLFAAAAEVTTIQEQKDADAELRKAMQDVIARSTLSETPTIQELWNQAKTDPELEHGVNVATYAVCFALAFGKSAPHVIGDLTVSGLLHDIGMSQLPPVVASKPWTAMTEEEQQIYHLHVQSSEALLSQLGETLSAGALEILRMHHEKFDGTGYPAGLSAFTIPDTAQILSMADLLETLSAGLWDGVERTRKEAFLMLETRDKNRTYPEYFNPETFKRVKKFIHSKEGQKAFEEASGTVAEETTRIVGGTLKTQGSTNEEDDSEAA
jgi:HD-GYP domain-containing protein (c-di-GMP phosphodiesterase class II)